jgi:protein SCO1/2
MSWRQASVFLVSGAGFLTFYYFKKSEIEEQREKSKTEGFGKPRVGGPFRLVDHFGNVVTEKTYLGRHMLLYFGYTVTKINKVLS